MIHFVDVDAAAIPVLLEASRAAHMTLLEFQAAVIKDWAERYQRRQRGWRNLEDALGVQEAR